MFFLQVLRHKRILIEKFSNCFQPLRDDLGNVPIALQSSKMITASVLGACRGYAIVHTIDERAFDILVDAVYEELFRRESVEVQDRAEEWLHSADQDFMQHYYSAKQRTNGDLDLNWLSQYAQEKYTAGHQVMFPL